MKKLNSVSKVLGMMAAVLTISAVGGAKNAQAVERQDRALLIVSNLTTFGDPKLIWLYQFLDASSVTLAQTMMAPHYRSIYALTGSNATATKYVNSLTTLGRAVENKVVDSFVHLHGSPSTLWFAGGAKSTSTLSNEIRAKNIGGRLRMLYSTACYGSSHAQDFVNAGFNVASGSRGVNANASFEYPTIMTQLGFNATFGQAIAAGNDTNARNLSDALARTQGFTGVDSYKIIRGNTAVRLSSSGI